MRKWCGMSIVLILMSFSPDQAPRAVNWKLLQKIGFEARFVKEVQADMLFPKFPVALTLLDGQQVIVEGYVIPYDQAGKKISLSANPYAACFFCGKAGPASVMTVNFETPDLNLKTDQYRKFIGRLRLNHTDFREFYYILEKAHLYNQ